jgi:CHAT domain-containing protein
MRLRRLTTSLLLIASVAAAACDRTGVGRSDTSLLGELREHAPYSRHFAPRLSVATTYHPCPDSSAADKIVRIATCRRGAEPPSAATLAFAGRVAAALKASSNPKTLHAAALVELLWSDAQGTSLDRSISLLSAASRSSEDADVLTDLAAAHLVRAERSQTPRDVVEAIEVASRALRILPSHTAARFNLALALDRVGLIAEAKKEWQRYLSVDSHSEWAAEARVRQRGVGSTFDDKDIPLVAEGDSAAATRFANNDAGSARAYGWDNLLGTWAEALLASDSIRANRALRAARLLGNAIERRGGDASLADAVGVIDQATDKSALRELATGHRAYAAGRAAYTGLKYDAAATELRASAASQSITLRQWSNVFLGGALVYQRRLSDGQDALRSVVVNADTTRHPALAARAAWSLGLTMVRAGSYADGVSLLRRAESWFDRARERENQGALAEIQAEVLFDRGDTDRGFDALQVALAMLDPYAKSVWHHNALWTGAREAARAGLPNAAARFAAEDARVAQATGLAAQVVESRLTRARLLLAAGDRVAADSEFGVARVALHQVPPAVRGWLEADLASAKAAGIVDEQPRDAIAQLDSVIEYFGTTQRHPVRLFPALVARAEALVAVGDTARATRDLTRAIEVVEARRDSFADLPDRAALLDAARPTFDRVVRLRLAAGKSSEALVLLERSRSALQRLTPRPGTSTNWSSPLVSPAGQTVVDYGLIGDTLVTWTIKGNVTQADKRRIDRAALRETIERLRTALELESQNDESLEDLSRLYDVLIGPVVTRFTPGETVVIVPDAELANVPFAALRDRSSRRYLVESYPIRVATDLQDATTAGRRRAVVRHALIIADPAFDAKAFRGLRRLGGAAREAQAIGQLYRDHATLAGDKATTSAATAAIRKSAVVHYAGHAVFNDERPERSMLALARDSAGGPIGLAAEAIARLDLGNVRLVVLSACESIRGRSTATGGFTGLAAAFRNAGADGVVGSLWRVDDESTAALMADFHREYVALGDPTAALRAAQLQYLKTAMGARASPFAWAAFRYVGT